MMTSSELWTSIRELSRADKLGLIQQLAADLAQEEQPQERGCPIWSPHDAPGVSAALYDLLEQEKFHENPLLN